MERESRSAQRARERGKEQGRRQKTRKSSSAAHRMPPAPRLPPVRLHVLPSPARTCYQVPRNTRRRAAQRGTCFRPRVPQRRARARPGRCLAGAANAPPAGSAACVAGQTGCPRAQPTPRPAPIGLPAPAAPPEARRPPTHLGLCRVGRHDARPRRRLLRAAERAAAQRAAATLEHHQGRPRGRRGHAPRARAHWAPGLFRISEHSDAHAHSACRPRARAMEERIGSPEVADFVKGALEYTTKQSLNSGAEEVRVLGKDAEPLHCVCESRVRASCAAARTPRFCM